MSNELLVIVVVVLAVAGCLVLLAMLYMSQQGSGAGSTSSDRLRALVVAQRGGVEGKKKSSSPVADSSEAIGSSSRESALALPLPKRLKYARWKITPIQFRLIQLAVIVACIASVLALTPFPMAYVNVVTATLVPFFVTNGVLTGAMNKRSTKFEEDFAAFLLSYVSLLKTGQSAMPALEHAAGGLLPDSLVRQEIEIILERLRFGMSEEQAISAFAEDIYHNEIELFVQALVLNLRVGGKLSSTLERLAAQVRKRQHFKESAVAAVGLERKSIYAIAGIMSALLGFLAWKSGGELVEGIYTTTLGLWMFGASVLMVSIGMIWARAVSNIRI